jgi:basic membrane lipoprotein Med (substrate-binding protein (PBP1-ABC) superfamily)
MKKKLLSVLVVAMCLVLAAPLFAGGEKEQPAPAPAPQPAKPVVELPTPEKPIRLGIVIPGALGDSPPYDSLADGARRFALRDKRIQLVNVFEMGFDQSKWVEKFVAFAASGKYDVVYSSNEALGAMAVAAAKQVPNVKFIVNDCYVSGNDRIFTSFFNKFEQGYLYGYTMALVSSSSMPGMNADKKIGLVYGQHYSTLDDLIAPGIEAGAKAVDPAFELKSVMLGNWYDAKKAESLANSLFDAGVDVIGSIAGSGNAGVIRAAVNRGAKVVYFDVAAFDKAPGTIVASVGAENGDLVMKNLQLLVEGKIPWGKPEVLGTADGYISMPLRAPGYVSNVPEDIRKLIQAEFDALSSGAKKLPVPQAVLDKINAASQAGGS